ncbi:hypothetical protein QYE76_009953 [Lolium multiflorum]|uniref:CCHC-type domain-containing protein n=1 Tax=Lolium multiflorum TaxID=4521 RepID=A0AAD8X1N6_LOLMU|nr:hypothetical protein QYE76_009953 [Lolium multiflorum]
MHAMAMPAMVTMDTIPSSPLTTTPGHHVPWTPCSPASNHSHHCRRGSPHASTTARPEWPGHADHGVGTPQRAPRPPAAPTTCVAPGLPLSTLSITVAAPTHQTRSHALALPVADDQLAGPPYDMMRDEVNVRPKPCAVPRLTVGLHWEAKLMGRGAYTRMTYQWESYQLGPEGDLKFEKELKQLVDYLGHPYPKFFGMPLKAKAGEPPQWDVSTDLRRKLDAPMAPPTRNNSRAQAKQIHPEHARMTEAISILAMERKALRHQHAKKDYLIARLRVKIASLERLIPILHHAPRAKSNVTCYACGVTGHYSNKCPMKAANNAPRTGSNAVPIAQTSKSMVTCYECGTVGHFSNECRKKLAKIAANPSALAQQQHHIATRRKFAPNYPNNRTGRYYHLKTAEAQEASRNMTKITKP